MSIEHISKICVEYDFREEDGWVDAIHYKLMARVDKFLGKYEIVSDDFFTGCPAASPSVTIEINHDPNIAREIEHGLNKIISGKRFRVLS